MHTSIPSKMFGQFLKSRRERVQPEEAGILQTSGRRRTPGLRREEVAFLSHVSVTYYTWLEQGKEIQPSREVLTNISKALRLSPDENEHLFNLAYNETFSLPIEKQYDDSLQAAVDKLPFPSFITDQRSKVIFWNREADKMIFPFSSCATEERYLLKLLFLESSFRDRIQNWSEFSSYSAAVCRSIYDRYPEDAILNQLLDNLKRQSKMFQNLWDQHHIQQKKVSFISINDKQGQTHNFRIHSASHVDGNEGLHWCMYVPE
ncbi:helix-turn-helix transcriptional regulator [Virgibacillus oceani]|uniref:Transcriptional regulator n=1 Tax=Virgibacillus oceani TaxID=1479511 RepID=A0A917M246_9BACI|nr:helix-turn-helix transcriptional regulator [Virgibacillus oceani]GGG72944.1 transcriptional regulator [Virgibacillus oceani]